ncbi:sigma-54-dependent Fis family transcriptional regulator [bacterium]|nr:sigma-54-dependent Fis family transcriptional regulator [bacterium]
MAKILVVDDEKKLVLLLKEEFEDAGYKVFIASNGEEGLDIFIRENPEIVISDIRMGQTNGIELLTKIKRVSPEAEVLLMTAYASVSDAIKSMKLGAYDYVMKPFNFDEILVVVEKMLEKQKLVSENKQLKEIVSQKEISREIIGQSAKIKKLLEMIDKVAPSNANVLIVGESGTGKELVARRVHEKSNRSQGPFIAINCAALTETLLESELFGHEKGSFTGAVGRKPGKFELANGGTILLDEIGEVSLNFQVKLLRTIQEKSFYRVGGSDLIKVDTRIIASTNKHLPELIKEGKFREDLFFRLNVFPLEVPPLRERKDDIPLLSEAFLKNFGVKNLKFSEQALNKLKNYNFPGNIRELENVIERATILTDGKNITPNDILLPDLGLDKNSANIFEIPDSGVDLEEIEKKFILLAIDKSNGNKSKAADFLTITRRSLYSKMEKHGIPI